ncbi:MAG: hypothetical protein BMS9Abin37_2046 [Acidobacteriota bacterium]|nr:MAG: hypothetical protein BMS9Abin37_2046 [Acidobacteriota bacterium]
MSITIDVQDDKVWIRFPFDRDLIDLVKAAVPGRRYDPEQKAWWAPVESLSAIYVALPDANYLNGCKDTAERKTADIIQRAGMSLKEGATQPEGIELELFEFQKAGVYLLNKLSHALLADEMGLGKTIQGIAWAHARKKKNKGCLVVCPASVKLNWEREIRRCRPTDRILVIDSAEYHNLGGLFGTPDWVIVNYDRIWREGCKRALRKCYFHSVIMDEAHYVKNLQTNRSKLALEFAGVADGVLAMTGTPIMNRPQELFATLVMLRKFRKKDQWWYLKRFCGATKTNYGWDFSGASRLAELHSHLKTLMVRRKKSEVLKDLPPKIYSYHMVEKLENMKEYSAAEKKLIVALQAGKISATRSNESLMELKRLCAMGKVKAAIDRLDACKDEGRKALIFCSYLEPLRQLHRHYSGSSVMIQGSNTTQQRQGAVDSFQNNRFVLFAFCSTMAASQGINMTAAGTVFFIDLPWTPAAKMQAEDRAHRIGQTRGLEVVNVLAQNSIDERLVRILQSKAFIINQAVDGGDAAPQEEKHVMRELRDSYRRS